MLAAPKTFSKCWFRDQCRLVSAPDLRLLLANDPDLGVSSQLENSVLGSRPRWSQSLSKVRVFVELLTILAPHVKPAPMNSLPRSAAT